VLYGSYLRGGSLILEWLYWTGQSHEELRRYRKQARDGRPNVFDSLRTGGGTESLYQMTQMEVPDVFP
jgi:hypothetical protein